MTNGSKVTICYNLVRFVPLEVFLIVASNIQALFAIFTSEKGSPYISLLSRALLISLCKAAADVCICIFDCNFSIELTLAI